MAKAGTSWRKGQSGNPGGRRKADYKLMDVAKVYTTEALQTLAAIMKSKKTGAVARVAAARELLDRGWGRPPVSVDVTNSDGSLSEAWRAAMKAADQESEEASVQH